MRTIEEIIYFKVFPEETEMCWESFYDWVSDNPQTAFNMAISIHKEIIRELSK